MRKHLNVDQCKSMAFSRGLGQRGEIRQEWMGQGRGKGGLGHWPDGGCMNHPPGESISPGRSINLKDCRPPHFSAFNQPAGGCDGWSGPGGGFQLLQEHIHRDLTGETTGAGLGGIQTAVLPVLVAAGSAAAEPVVFALLLAPLHA